MRRRSRLFAVPAVAALLVALTASSGRASPDLESVPSFGHVFLIIGENTDLSQLNKTNAPYQLGTIEPNSAWLTNYFALTHYSEANYVGMVSGQFTTCEQKDGLAASCHQDVPNLFAQLDSAGISWLSWMESMPSQCYLVNTGGDAGLNHYAAKHNPALFFDGIEGTSGTWTDPGGPECMANDIPAGTTGPNDMTAFNNALSTNTGLARFNLVVPNECEDAHDNCKPAGNPITQYDNFLANEITAIQTWGQTYGDGDWVIIVTYDEGITNSPKRAIKFGNGGNVVFAVMGPQVHNAVYEQTGFTHYSLLRTLEDGFGISTYVGHAADASPINTIWNP
jgi:hypothetical protein